MRPTACGRARASRARVSSQGVPVLTRALTTADETYAKHKILQEEEARETPISECVFLSVQKVSSLGAS